jgi:hypothetical protein
MARRALRLAHHPRPPADARRRLVKEERHPIPGVRVFCSSSSLPLPRRIPFAHFSRFEDLRIELWLRSDVTFQDDAGVEYVWKNNKPGLALQVLYLTRALRLLSFQVTNPCVCPALALRSAVQVAASGPFYSLVQGFQGRSREPACRALDAPPR